MNIVLELCIVFIACMSLFAVIGLVFVVDILDKILKELEKWETFNQAIQTIY